MTTAVVLAGHAGAGATTVALALAEALAYRAAVQLVDVAEPARCGLSGASPVELGIDERGWRHGRRGELDLVRHAEGTTPGAPPRPPEPLGRRPGLRVLDRGAATCALTDVPAGVAGVADVVVVTRLTVPGLRQTETVLGLLDRPVLVAAVGRCWRRRALPPLGPGLARAAAAGRLVLVPWDRRLAAAGLDEGTLPSRIGRAGAELARRLSCWPAPTTAGPAPVGKARP